jgi:DNA-binding HxlR family transcriptional regulator
MKTETEVEIPTPYRCPVTATMQLIGGKWKIIILWAITNNVNRFGALQRAIPDITKKMLTSELRALEAEGLISRKVYAVVPPKVEYSITPLGASLGPVLNAMGDWGQAYALPMQLEKSEMQLQEG